MDAEMAGSMKNRVLDQMPRPSNELMPGTETMLLQAKDKQDRRNGKHECRIGAKGFKQLPGLSFKLEHAPTVSGASIRIFLAREAIEYRELG